MARSYFTHDNWLELQADKGVPVLSDCYVEDLRTLELAHWDIRDCDTAFIRFTDMGGVTEARVQEIPAGGSLKPFKLGVEEMVYVLKGRGFASVWGEISNAKRDFEWSDRSVFVIPRNSWCELRNMGSTPVRLLFYNYLPIGMSVIPDPEFFMNNPHVNKSILDDAEADFFSEAKDIEKDFGSAWGAVGGTVWSGNFWPDLLAWDKLMAAGSRGAGGSSIAMYVPGSEISSHMSVFPAGTYKKAHRHGPGRLIVIPGGEGFSVMWPEGGENEKRVFPWHEGQRSDAARSVVPSAFQPWGQIGPLLRAPPARAIPGQGRGRGRQRGRRQHRVRRRGSLDASTLRRGAGQAGPRIAYAAGGLHRRGL